MTDNEKREIAQRLRDSIQFAPHTSEWLTDQITSIADELDPPRPEPGAVVWWRVAVDDIWHLGVVVDYGIVPADNVNACWNWDFKGLEYKPARILATDQVPVKIPPVSEWPEMCDEYVLRWHFANHGYYAGVSVTRAEAEAMEADND